MQIPLLVFLGILNNHKQPKSLDPGRDAALDWVELRTKRKTHLGFSEQQHADHGEEAEVQGQQQNDTAGAGRFLYSPPAAQLSTNVHMPYKIFLGELSNADIVYLTSPASRRRWLLL